MNQRNKNESLYDYGIYSVKYSLNNVDRLLHNTYNKNIPRYTKKNFLIDITFLLI